MISKILHIICCIVFGHEYKNIGNQNGYWYKCVKCGQKVDKKNNE
jgi:hypothetical protein